MCPSKHFPPIVTQRDDCGLDTSPSKIPFECTGDVRLSASWETDGAHEDLTGMEQKT